jgi:uncharacterized membrane protein YeiH
MEQTVSDILHGIDLAGTAVFAISGALAAGKKHMDIFGVMLLACVTALGGGTLRDIILGRLPVFWVKDALYLSIAVSAGVFTFIFAGRWRFPMRALLYADAIGLAVFTVIGFEIGFAVTRSFVIAIVMGISSGVVGGIIRDMLAGEIPLILRREIYASASACGGALFAAMLYFNAPSLLTIVLSISVTLGIRLIALRWNLALPQLRLSEPMDTE